MMLALVLVLLAVNIALTVVNYLIIMNIDRGQIKIYHDTLSEIDKHMKKE